MFELPEERAQEALWDEEHCPVFFSDDARYHIAMRPWLRWGGCHLYMETVPVSDAPGELEIRMEMPGGEKGDAESKERRPLEWHLVVDEPEIDKPEAFEFRMSEGDADLLAGLRVEYVCGSVEHYFVFSNPRLEFTDHLGRRFRRPGGGD